MRKFVISTAILMLLFVASASTAFVASEINVTIDGVAIDFEGQPPTIVDGRTLVPVRGVFEHLGFNIGWSQTRQAAILTDSTRSINITIGYNTFTVDRTLYPLDVPAQIIDGRTMLPIRSLLEAVGYDVDWDAATQTVVISSTPWNPAHVGDAEIHVMWWGNDARRDAMLAALDIFMERYPNVTIEPMPIPWGNYIEMLHVMLAAGTLPDLVQIDYTHLHRMGGWGDVFLNLDDMSHILDLSRWDDSHLDFMRINGELAAVPRRVDGRVVVYYRPLLEEFGLTTFPATIQELIVFGQLISAENLPHDDLGWNRYALANTDNALFDFMMTTWLYDTGGSHREVAANFGIFDRLLEAGAVQNTNQEWTMGGQQHNWVWAEGRSAGVFVWSSSAPDYMNSLMTAMGESNFDNFGVTTLPMPPGAAPVTMHSPPFGHAISSWTVYPEVTAYLLNFLYTDPAAIAAIGNTLGYPILDSVQEILDTTNMGIIGPHFYLQPYWWQRIDAINDFRGSFINSHEAAQRFIEAQRAAIEAMQ